MCTGRVDVSVGGVNIIRSTPLLTDMDVTTLCSGYMAAGSTMKRLAMVVHRATPALPCDG